MNYKKLDELNKLRQSGALTDEEFEREKQKILNEENVTPVKGSLPLGMDESTYLALMSFLILLPYIGWIIPIVMWIAGKDSSTAANQQGKYILNWYISWFIFSIILGVFLLIAVFSGIGSLASLSSGVLDNISPFGMIAMLSSAGGGMIIILLVLAIVGLLSLLFPIIGGIKGLNGQTWKYPLSIPFLK